MSVIEIGVVLAACALICVVDTVVPAPSPENRPRGIRLTREWFGAYENGSRLSSRPNPPAPHRAVVRPALCLNGASRHDSPPTGRGAA